ncbi:MAG: iron-sulfur cluster assembly scaffold protein [Nevskia sp.]|nr:iron-sulfur cluster assembly scaffold protein [Nevskia sp.]
MAQPSTDANPFGYSEAVWRLFNQAPRAGAFAPGTAGVVAGTAQSNAAHAVLRIELQLAGGRVADSRFRAYGCPTTIAVGAWLAGWSLGRTVAELRALGAADLRAALEFSDDRAHCGLLGEDALRNALEKLQR